MFIESLSRQKPRFGAVFIMPNAQKLMADRSRMQESRAARKTMLDAKARDKAAALAAAKKTGQSAT